LDELNFSLAIDNKMAKFWEPLAPHHNLFVLNSPRATSGNNAIPKPDVATMSSWLDSTYEPPVSEEQMRAFDLLPDA
jgi:hypothetical protein